MTLNLRLLNLRPRDLNPAVPHQVAAVVVVAAVADGVAVGASKRSLKPLPRLRSRVPSPRPRQSLRKRRFPMPER